MSINPTTAADFALLAGLAESLTGQGDAPPLPAPFADRWQIVGYLSARNALLGGQVLGLGDRCYYGFVVASKTDPSLLVACVRGTELPVEWMEDGEALLVPSAFGGCVHGGFVSIFQTLAFGSGMTRAANAIAGLGNVRQVFCVGHSLGAPLAIYLMAALRTLAPPFAVDGCFFACPKPGDGHFAHWFDSLVGADHYDVFNYSRDLVPKLPFSGPFGLGFQALPRVTWITPAMSSAIIAAGVQCAHSATSYAALLNPASVPKGGCVS